MTGSSLRRSLAYLGMALLVVGAATAPAGAVIEDAELESAVHRSIDRGLKWLRAQQKDDGSWENYPGITGLVLTAFTRSPRAYTEDDGPFIRDGARYLRGLAKENGGIYDKDLPVYNTAVSMMALCSLSNPEHASLLRKARGFLVGQQTEEGEGYESTDKFYGGIGYGNDERPDLSNLQFAMESLRATDLPDDHPAWDRAIQFLQRCQNRSESNDQTWAANDGGFVYYPGFSVAGETKSYGSMTYAGIKSFIFAQLDRKDPRVQAAMGWIRENYTLDEHPGLGVQGLYYYYHTFAKALRVYGEPRIEDGKGKAHVWAEELARVLLARQDEDGFWVNSESPRWWEGNAVLVTAEAILALEEALAELGPDDRACPSLSVKNLEASGGAR
jgi:squalene-hopene/tetraprenyl-beta-curcumene cyclase